MSDFLTIVGKGDPLSRQVSDALILLIRSGAELGELDQIEITDPHSSEPRIVKSVPPSWLRRLARAADVGAFQRHPIETIAHRILTTEGTE